MNIRFLSIFLAYQASVTVQKVDLNACFKSIYSLSDNDAKLSTRMATKHAVALLSANDTDFVARMKNTSIRESGPAYACGLTRSYVSEVFAGLKFQYTELLDEDPEGAAYAEYFGQDVVDLFTEKAQSTNHFIFQLRHLGTQDHDLVVEQLPKNTGYRVYQSYHDAYSLNAWLSNSTKYHNFFKSKDMMIFTTVQANMNASLLQLTNGQISLKNLDDLPSQMSAFKPYLVFVRDYNESQATNYFKIARTKYGSGKVLSKDAFFAAGGYLDSTKTLTQFFKDNDSTTNTFTQEQWDLWISLYGSPDPIFYPNLPDNLISSLVVPDATYSFQIKVVDLGSDEKYLATNCTANAKILENTLKKAPKKLLRSLFEEETEFQTY